MLFNNKYISKIHENDNINLLFIFNDNTKNV